MDVDNSCAGTSVYLSFDESTTSNMTFKTLEASSMDLNETLEGIEEPISLSRNGPSAKKISKSVVNASPHRAFNANKMFKDFRPFSSTPSKEQLYSNVKLPRDFERHHDIDFGVAPLGDIEEEDKDIMPTDSLLGENKENAQPENEDNSSVCETVTTVIERKMMTVLPEAAGNAKKPMDQISLPAVVVDKPKSSQMPRKPLFVANSNKRLTMQAPKNMRRTICEPDLKTNRPSRIAINTNMKRTSLASSVPPPMRKNDTKVTQEPNTGNENKNKDITSLLNRALKINEETAIKNDISKATTSKVNHGEKRTYNSISKRMSVIVKTTLNSPAYKIARRGSIASGLQAPAGRRSILPVKTGHTIKKHQMENTAHSAMKKKSMLPVSQKDNVAATTSAQVKANLNSKFNVQSSNSQTNGASTTKPERILNNFNCNLCSSKFSIKSLLDAHKRSHEDMPIVASQTLMKKPSMSTINAASTSNNAGNDKQCKYCDKQFALIRTLHIHLLQNCPKIPPKEKRKLQFTELQHVEKAQLPTMFHTSSSVKPATTLMRTNSEVTVRPRIFPSSLTSSMDSMPAAKSKDITDLANDLMAAVDGVLTKMPPPVDFVCKTKKKKKQSKPHSGVYSTPNKTVPCHTCKISFDTVLQYTNHTLAFHVKSPNGPEDDVKALQGSDGALQ